MRRTLLFGCLLLVFAVDGLAAQAESFGLRLIVVRTETEANNVLARLRTGEKFDLLAQTVSVDSSARQGGYLGIFTKSELRTEFQAALEGLKPGETSSVVRIGLEFALLQLLTTEEMRAVSGKTPAAVKNVNAVFEDGSTLLMGAAQTGDMDKVRTLIADGALVNAQTRDGLTALILAAQSGHADVVQALLAAGADVNARKADGGTALMDAAFGGHLAIILSLLESRADPNITLTNGSTALMAASLKGHNDIVRALIGAGAQINAEAAGGTALMEAAYAGKLETVRILLSSGADPKLANQKGLTALMGAALGGYTEIVQALIAGGAPISPRDSRGWTALTHARASSNPATVRLILANAGDIPPQDRSIALGGTYLNEYYSSNDANLLSLAAAEFQKVLSLQPQNLEGLEWMGAVEFLRWDKPPTLDQFRKSSSPLRKAVDLDPKDPDRHCWIAATSSIFASTAKVVSPVDKASILEDGIQHAKKAIELDPQFADAMEHLSVLYRRKSELISSERDQLLKLSDTAHQDAVRVRQRLGNRPSRFNDQFSRPALPPAP